MEDDVEVPVKESRRDALAKAWDEVEEKESIAVEEKPLVKEKAATEELTESPTKEEKEKSVEPKPDDADKKEAKAAAEIHKPAAAPVTDKAPNSWKPGIREHWGKLPAEVRAEVSRREKEIQQTLSQTAQVRKFAQDFAQTVNPYAHLIRAQNSTPLQAVNNLMQTAAGLMQGNQEQKAKIVADIIANYGIDVQTLDKVLTGSYNPQNVHQPQQAPVPQWAQPIFGFMDNIQRVQQLRAQELQEVAAQTIESFTEKPFFEDVREDMADLLEAAANRGRVLTIEQAYEKAIALNPEISRVIEQRKLVERNRNPVSEAAATLARARKAASSVKGAPSGTKTGAPNGKLSRRQQLLEAWDESQS